MRRRLGHWEAPHGRARDQRGDRPHVPEGARRAGAVPPEPSPERFHDWRKQVKAFSNELRLIRGAIPELTTTLMPKIEALGELLGEVHDLHCATATAELHPRSFGRAEDGRAVLAAVEERRGELERQALALAETVFAGRPRDVRALIKTGWRIWRRGESPAAAAEMPATLH